MIIISAYKIKEEALISKALLEAAGVPVTLIDECGELQLQVRDTDAQLAQQVLLDDDSPEWKFRGPRRNRFRGARGDGVAKAFFKGGAALIVAVLLFCLLLLPLGIPVRVTPFGLLTLLVVGGCCSVVKHSFKIKRKRLQLRRAQDS